MPSATLILALCAMLVVAHADELRLVDAGTGGSALMTLTNGAVICPDDYKDKGFSVECVSSMASKAIFNLNGKPVRTENVKPFMIAGDRSGNVYKWMNYVTGKNVIACYPTGGDMPKIEVSVTFECDKMEEKSDPKPTKTPTPSMSKSSPAPMPPKTQSGSCVVIPGASYSGPLTKGWEEDGTAVVFEKNNPKTGVYESDKARLTYKFKPVVSGYHGFTLDMTTSDGTEHNDVFVQSDIGFTLRRFDLVRNGGKGFIKAYHNKNGRARQAYSVDFEAHSFCTSVSLEAGKEYTITIGARSTKVTIHNLLLFPCPNADSNAGCVYTNNPFWTSSVNQCKV